MSEDYTPLGTFGRLVNGMLLAFGLGMLLACMALCVLACVAGS